MAHRSLNQEEAARLLNVPAWTVARWVRQGLLPGNAPSPELRFDRAQIERWARRHGIPLARSATTAQLEPEENMLADALDRGAFRIAPPLETASDAIALAVRALPCLEDDVLEALLRDVLDRERMASTAFGKGVALPHPRRPPSSLLEHPVISIVRSERPLDWAALDGEPVDVVILVLAPSVSEHLELLSRASVSLQVPEFAATLRHADSKDEIGARLREIRMDK